MNHYVPDFEMDHDEFTIPTSSTLTRQKATEEDDIKELLWQDGQVIVQSQTTPRSDLHKSPLFKMPRQPDTNPNPNINANTSNNQLFMGEDEMAAWLHYPFEDLYTDLLYPTSASQPVTQGSGIIDAARPPHPPPLPAPPPKPPVPPAAARNFPLFSRLSGRGLEAAPVSSRTEMTVVDSNDTPEPAANKAPPPIAPPSAAKRVGDISPAASRSRPAAGVGGKLREGGGSGDMTVTSSPSGSGSGTSTGGPTHTVDVPGDQNRERENKKRKAKENDDTATATAATTATEDQTEDVELESADEKKYSRGSTGTKRSRAAEVHNLSERRRRDRINEKMKALQELIPRCNKSDKASMLDEAIEYLKSLQMQVQESHEKSGKSLCNCPSYIPLLTK